MLLSALLLFLLSSSQFLSDLLLRGSTLKPWMTHDTRDAEALFRLFHQHARDKVFELLAEEVISTLPHAVRSPKLVASVRGEKIPVHVWGPGFCKG